nr:Gag-Pol polyprotein [Tanacetum cinerariifolium]
MSNISNNMQTQTSNTLHNAIMEAGSKDHPPMLASGNYIQWKSRIKRYIDTKPNHELISYCLENSPYELGWKTKPILDSDGNPTTSTERVFETYKTVTQEIRDQLNAEAEGVQIILTRIDNDIYSTVDACPNACEIWKAIERLKQGESINVQDLETNLFWEFGKFTSLDGESLESYYSRFYKLMNELTRNQCKVTNHQEIRDQLNAKAEGVQIILTRIDNDIYSTIDACHNACEIWKVIERLKQGQRSGNVAGARETIGSSMVQKFGIKCYNCKEYRHVARECQKPKRAKDAAYHWEKMLLYAHNVTIESEDMNYNSEQIDQNDEDADLAEERELLASLIEKLKCEIDETKNRNTLLETSNKVLVEKLKSDLEDFKTKNNSLTEANNKLSKENDLLFADFMKSKAKL